MATTYTNMTLKSWNAASDVFSYADLDANWSKVDVHDHTTGKGVQIPLGGLAPNSVDSTKIVDGAIVNADINAAAGIVGTKLAANTVTNDKIATADLQKLGLSDSVVRRGYVANVGPGTRTNAAYGSLSDAADQIANVVIPANSILFVGYQATWAESVAGVARASIFIGSNQLAIGGDFTMGTNGQHSRTRATVTVNREVPLFSTSIGLASANPEGFSVNYSGDVATGQVFGFTYQNDTAAGYGTEAQANGSPINEGAGVVPIFVTTGGTYTISVQFKSASGTITAKNRKLWVYSMGF